MLWIRPALNEQRYQPDERRVREFLAAPSGISESVASLAAKLEISSRRCRRILEQLVEEGIVQRQDFADIQPVYYRFPDR